MIRRLLHQVSTKNWSPRCTTRPRRGARPWVADALEGRVLLTSTVYTVTNTSGLADVSGSLPNAVNQANHNSNPARQHDRVCRERIRNQNSPGIIDLAATLDLSNTAGTIVIQGGSDECRRSTPCKSTVATRWRFSRSATASRRASRE